MEQKETRNHHPTMDSLSTVDLSVCYSKAVMTFKKNSDSQKNYRSSVKSCVLVDIHDKLQ